MTYDVVVFIIERESPDDEGDVIEAVTLHDTPNRLEARYEATCAIENYVHDKRIREKKRAQTG